MKKTTIYITLIIILITIGTFISLNNFLFTGRIIEHQDFHFSTIAICNETNYCEDYEVECKGEKIIRRTATGYSIQHDEDWRDPRGKQKANLCE